MTRLKILSILAAIALSLGLLKTYETDIRVLLSRHSGNFDEFVIGGIEGDNKTVIDTTKALYGCKKGQTITIHVASPGGNVGVALTLIKAELKAKCDVKVIVEDTAYSAATYIAFAGHTVVFADGSDFMFHMPRYIALFGQGKQVPLADQMDLIKLADSLYGHVLTNEEIDLYLKGEDVFINGATMNKRIANPVGEKGRFTARAEAKLKLLESEKEIKAGSKS